MNHLRSKFPTFPWKQDTDVVGLASEWGYQFGGRKRKSVTNEIKGKVEKFYCRTVIVYIMPGKGDEMNIWTGEGRKRAQKYFLTIYPKET